MSAGTIVNLRQSLKLADVTRMTEARISHGIVVHDVDIPITSQMILSVPRSTGSAVSARDMVITLSCVRLKMAMTDINEDSSKLLILQQIVTDIPGNGQRLTISMLNR